MRVRPRWLLLVGLVAVACAPRSRVRPIGVASAEVTGPARSNLVKQANAPISSILQLRFQDSFAPEFVDAHGRGNVATVSMTMPFPEYRLLPIGQLSLLALPAAVTRPDGSTGVGDLRFVDIGVSKQTRRIVWGVGPSLVFPTANEPGFGQGKWQAGPAAAVAYTPEGWIVGVLAQNPIAFAGDRQRQDANALFLQPFVTLQLGKGWFVRSQPQMVFNWVSHEQLLPVDVGLGRVFTVGRQNANCFVEPFWNASTDGPAPRYGVTLGVALLYPNFWQTP